jgi:membrane peptidoglycan carboxypeptidase
VNKLSILFRRGAVIAVVGGVAVGACLAAIIPGAQVIGLAHRYTGEIDSLGQLSQRTTVYDSAGQIIGTLGIENRTPIKYEEVPQTVIDAVIAIEDKTFWDNPGVDVGGVFRAFVENVTAGEIEQGGSTITQQLVKKRVLSEERTLDRKVREVVLAYRLNQEYSKEQILTEYLNTVYFGQGSYGLQSAAERFFSKPDLSQLTLGEAALLAGLIQSPEGDNPFVTPERAVERRTEVLDAEVKEGYITQEEADLAKLEPLPTNPPPTELKPENDYVEEVQAVLLQDERLGDTEQERQDAVLQGGLQIHTAWDQNMQAQAEDAVLSTVGEGGPFTGALVAMDPRNGQVKAMVPGPGFAESQFNVITDGIGQQVGSTWKIVTLATVIANGYSGNDSVDGGAPCSLRGFDGSTRNAGDSGGGGTIRASTAGSVNCAFVRMAGSVGYEKVAEMATLLGLRPITDPADPRPLTEDWDTILTLTLGTVETTPLEMATVASTLSASGVRRDPVFVTKVLDPDGNVIFDDSAPPGAPVMTEEAANCTVDILHGSLQSGGTASGKGPVGHDAWGKTGTTDNQVDANFVGGTRQLAAFVWYGSTQGNVSGAGFGGEVPATIWNKFMNAALAGLPDEPFPKNLGPTCDAPGQRLNPDGGRGGPAVVERPVETQPVETIPTLPAPDPGPTPTAPTTPTPTISIPPITAPTNPPPTTTPTPGQ